MGLDAVYRRNNSFVYRHVAGEAILVPICRHVGDLENIYTLNLTAAFIWEHLDGRQSLRQIRQRIVAEFDVSNGVAENDLLEFLRQLSEIGAVWREWP
jgi:hypothetical protein